MAFSSAIDTNYPTESEGNLRVTRGTFTNSGGATGGDINTGLNQVYSMTLQHTGNAAVASAPSINETFPIVGSPAMATIVTTANASGIWEAKGK